MKKSMVKMHGVKAVYHVSKGVNVVTAFGRGNESVLEQQIEKENFRVSFTKYELERYVQQIRNSQMIGLILSDTDCFVLSYVLLCLS